MDRLLTEVTLSLVRHRGKEHFNMAFWYFDPQKDCPGQSLEDPQDIHKLEECGTTACLAGWAHTAHLMLYKKGVSVAPSWNWPETQLADSLGIPEQVFRRSLWSEVYINGQRLTELLPEDSLDEDEWERQTAEVLLTSALNGDEIIYNPA